MFLFRLSALLCLVASVPLITTIKAQTDTSFVRWDCPNTTTFSPNSTYQSNLKKLLSLLPENASRENGYYRSTVGVFTPNGTVYGALLCRGDLTADACRECGSLAAKDVLEKCPVEKQSVIWHSRCTLRYSNEYFFSMVAEKPVFVLVDMADIVEQSLFRQLLEETFMKVVDEAANGYGGAGKKFATREANFSCLQRLYTLAQCMPDLSVADCNKCLQTSITYLLERRRRRVLTPSCNARYELYPFYTPQSQGVAPTPVESRPPSEGVKFSSQIIIGKSQISAGMIVAIVVSSLELSLWLLFFACWFITRRRLRKYSSMQQENVEISSVESLQFDLHTVKVATNNFCDDNKLGEGGFGKVYKGFLANGRHIAVKRLSRSSRQGAQEFKNEVALVAKLQHRNLVSLLGFCLDGEEKILIYEFVANKSLDHFLFYPDKKHALNWSIRYKIIEGIARGMLYLHEDSRFKIIHRDLKTSNILLDEYLNPKISDFGMARIFGVDQTQANTSRIVGTLGYMSPEYAIYGHFSAKLDVYSFGIIVLEIVSGRRNTSSQDQSGHDKDLLSHVWKKWSAGTPVDLLDKSLIDSYSRDEVTRCIHIGLLCVQEDPTQRPTMQTVFLMLNSHSITLSIPRRPLSFLHSQTQCSFPNQALESHTSTTTSKLLSIDEASVTDVYPR